MKSVAVQRRTLWVLALAQVLSGFGLAAGVTVGALLAAQLWESTSLAGLPAVLFTVGSAGAAVLIARVADRTGRRKALALGYLSGALGGVGVVVAVTADVPLLLLASFVIYGGGSAANLQARFAGADLAPADRKASAVATVLVATTVGAVAGPMLAHRTGMLAVSWSLDALLGPFMLASLAYLLGSGLLWVMLRPDPLLEARRLREAMGESAPHSGNVDVVTHDVNTDTPVATVSSAPWRRSALVGVGIMIIGQVVMIAVMTMTPIHMGHFGHGVGQVGMVIGLHVAAMYLPSPLMGWLVDRRGPASGAGVGAAALVMAGVVGALAPGHSVAWMALSLIALGVGWSGAMVAGSAIVVRAVPAQIATRVQGRADAVLALSGAGGAGASGWIMQETGYAGLAWLGVAVATMMIPFVVAVRRRRVPEPDRIETS